MVLRASGKFSRSIGTFIWELDARNVTDAEIAGSIKTTKRKKKKKKKNKIIQKSSDKFSPHRGGFSKSHNEYTQRNERREGGLVIDSDESLFEPASQQHRCPRAAMHERKP